MKKKIKFFITDVFGEEKYSGNQLATLINSDSLSDIEMQKIAREINFSETTFVLSDKPVGGGYDVRIFTPGAEIDFAGHPTLGTAYIIQKHILKEPSEEVTSNLKVGQIPVTFSTEKENSPIWMKQVEPVFGEIKGPEDVNKMIGLAAEDIHTNFPIQEVSTGLPHLIIPLKTIDGLKRVKIDRERYSEYIKNSFAKVILVFCPEGYAKEQYLGVRVFPVCLGIPEDPATGSGNGCLAGYLVKNRYLGSDSIDICTGQGYEIGRPSQLYLRASGQKGSISIYVGGKVVPIAEGWWG